jgi:Lamin Tail Domain
MLRRIGCIVALMCGVLTMSAPSADAASNIQFGRIQYNAPGTDTNTNTSVNGEYVQIKNHATHSVIMTHWTLRDAQSHVYTFGTFTLAAGSYVNVHTGKGTNSTHVRYWGLGWHVWNNTGDTATLKNASGVVMDRCSWTGSTAGYTLC